MEPLAHTLVGATLAETRLGRWTPLAPAALILAANLPDIDVATYLVSSDYALGHRRGWTHGVLAMAVLPLLLALGLAAWDRWVRRRWRPQADPLRWRALLGVSYVAFLTHPFLDWLNNYGIRLLAPFDDRWFYGDALFIVDPWLWLLLGGALFLLRSHSRWGIALWAALGTATTAAVLLAAPEPAAKIVWCLAVAALVGLRLAGRTPASGTPAGHRVAVAALAAAAIYIGVMVASVPLARSAVLGELAARPGLGPVRSLMVGPVPVDPFTRQVVAALPGAYEVGRFHWLGAPRLTLDRPLRRTAPSAAVRAARSSPAVAGFVRWARFPFYRVEETPAGLTVYLLDARYTRTPTTGFGGAVVHLTPDLEPLPATSGRARGAPRRRHRPHPAAARRARRRHR